MHSIKTAALLALLASPALAQTTLSGFATADNTFTASISTSLTAAGTTWFSGDNWQNTYSSSIAITDPGTYYLQVRTLDWGRPEMFIGNFTLDGPGALFANGSQTLKTNTLDWFVSTSGFGLDTKSPILMGNNGTSPWGTFPAMQDAQFIWAPQYDQGSAYFTGSFTVVPAPTTPVALATMALFAIRRRR